MAQLSFDFSGGALSVSEDFFDVVIRRTPRALGVGISIFDMYYRERLPCPPNISQISGFLGCSKHTVSLRLVELVESGALELSKKGKRKRYSPALVAGKVFRIPSSTFERLSKETGRKAAPFVLGLRLYLDSLEEGQSNRFYDRSKYTYSLNFTPKAMREAEVFLDKRFFSFDWVGGECWVGTAGVWDER